MNDKHTLINGLETGAEKKTPLFFLLLFQVQQHRKENTLQMNRAVISIVKRKHNIPHLHFKCMKHL